MTKILSIVLFFGSLSFGANLNYSLIKKDSNTTANTLLVIGGIHGDEPGGYFAPMILSRYYTIQAGSLWIVPNLNFDSIVENKRGIYGDMNRKFESVKPDDKDFDIVNNIKQLMIEPKVDLILNLHDGHGFYRTRNIDKLFNSQAWGQATIIDQVDLPNVKFGNLNEIATQVSSEANIGLAEDVHEFNVKNTFTKEKDKSMQLSLTYFAIKNNKPAFAIETSKNISSLNLKVFYQLKTIEQYMNMMGIKFSRSFNLSFDEIQKLLLDNGVVSIDGVAKISANNLRAILSSFPIDKKGMRFSSDNPLLTIVPEKDYYKLMNGNKFIARLNPEFYDFDDSLKNAVIEIDGVTQDIEMGSSIKVKKSFKISSLAKHRVNIIGFSPANTKGSETELEVSLDDMQSRFSLDDDGLRYRIDFYKQKSFSGMIIAEFEK